ncbi:MAG: 2-oxoglutarate dehydrogenase E1 component, partial [Bacteroidetes bacterium]|nr:2-oxoglutarate dehydrogenase E1 component [Bacteroidota bacterium]
MKDFQYITNAHPSYIEQLYRDFVKDPASVDPEYRKFFEGFDFAVGHSLNGAPATATAAPASGDVNWMGEINAYRLILGYRNKGHLIAKTNPIRTRKDRGANLDLSFFGFSEKDLDQTYHAGNLLGLGATTLRNIVAHLQQAYASSVGVEFKYISDQRKIDFLTTEIEQHFKKPLDIEKRRRILEKLNQGVIFEKFLHTKYIGQKRFSLEGGETTIAALDAIINTAAEHDVHEVVIGMAHRGRLNVLANIMDKTYEQIFSEF